VAFSGGSVAFCSPSSSIDSRIKFENFSKTRVFSRPTTTLCAMQSSNKENVYAQLLASPAASTWACSSVKNASVQRLRASARGQSYSPATAKEILLEALGPSPTREELSR